MTRSREPMLLCDGDEGACGAESRDFHDSYASTVGGVKITDTERAPGWVSTRYSDLCPQCVADGKTADG